MSEAKEVPLSVRGGRWALALFAVLASFALGFWLGESLSGWTDENPLLRKGVPALGLGLLLALLRQILSLGPKLFDYARSGDLLELWKPIVTVLFCSLMLALALHLVDLAVGEKPAGNIVVWNGLRALPAEPRAGEGGSQGPYAVFPVFFGEAGGYDPQAATFTTGTRPGPPEERMVRSLVRGLLGCAGGEEGEVQLSVRGFASSSGYSSAGSSEESDALNLAVAHARADSVLAIIREEVGGAPGLVATAARWESIEAMSGAQSFRDTAAGEYVPEVGFLTRRSEILLEDPGACRVRQSAGFGRS